MNHTDQHILRQGLQRAWMFWGAMATTLLVYVLITQVISKEGLPALPAAIGSKMTFIVYGIALLAFVFAGVVRRAMVTARGEISARVAAARYLSAVILSVAICETIAILGLVLYFIGVETDVVYILVLAAAVAMFIYRPRLTELEQLARSH
jgi:hypothetical protein